MKNLFYTLIITIITFTSCKAQEIVNIDNFNNGNNEGKYFKDINNTFAPYLGVWEWQNGNQIFRVTFWKLEMDERENGNRPSYYKDEILGHYELVSPGQIGGQVEETIYTSQKNIGNSVTPWPHVIRTGTEGGIIRDVSLDYPNQPEGITGHLKLNLIQTTNPLQLEWNVTLPDGMYSPDQPTTFNIPTNITLTKVN